MNKLNKASIDYINVI